MYRSFNPNLAVIQMFPLSVLTMMSGNFSAVWEHNLKNMSTSLQP